MPVYVYHCEDCGLEFEKIQSFSADPLTECVRCSGHVHRVIQPVGVIFKGSGFYVTDNRSKSSTMPTTKRDTQSSDDEKPAATKEKPVEKSEAKATEGD